MHAPFAGLPQEILDIIIDFLHDDKQSLDACSRVAQAWLHPARFHLFHRLTLRPRMFVLAARLFSHSPATAEYVRELRIEEPSLLDNLISTEMLLEMLQFFPHVQALHLNKIALMAPPLSTGVLRWQHPLLHRLRLTLYSQSPPELFYTLALFSAVPVAELRVDDPPLTWSAAPATAATLDWELFHGWQVGRLILPQNLPQLIDDLVQHACAAGAVQELVVLDFYGQNGVQLAAFLAQTGPSIQSLTWIVDDPDGRSYWTRMAPRECFS
jgi:hypothetical protein